jgi:4-phospho-D-threonate 3-dehydrogenase / 4-phospho-D-erythronate 3-dehydrogenase
MAIPRIAIPMGDPAGVGPELCLRALGDSSLQSICIPVVLGDATVLAAVAKATGQSLRAKVVSLEQWGGKFAEIREPMVVDFAQFRTSQVIPGKVCRDCGRASLAYIDEAIAAAVAGKVNAIVTGPINKEAIHLAGSRHIGHTEILAGATNSPKHLMMLTSREITCSLVTAHVGLAAVAELLTTEKVISAMELTIDAMKKMRGVTPRLTVCGLNPHAGEGGLIGEDEDARIITPAIEEMRRRGFEVTGPLSPDTAFLPARRKQTDAYICMYHDQGLIPLKMLAFDDAINITLGLPIVRTSVDHGTAFDIAWKGIANPQSMFEAIRLAAKLSTPSA